MNLTFAAALAVGAVLVAFGAFTAAWRRDGATSLAAIPMLAAGAAICMAGASRFSAAPGQAVTGQEFAAMITMVGLAAAIVGRAFSARGVER